MYDEITANLADEMAPPNRHNPIGLHCVEIVSIEGNRFRVRNLEALHATPIVDVKPVLTPARP
jgi:tRNA (Thr-GGU) A37 N-methylase